MCWQWAKRSSCGATASGRRLRAKKGRELKRKDVRDYAQVLLQALTQQRTLEGAIA